jgi:uncharacterized phage-like protein YoqJ
MDKLSCAITGHNPQRFKFKHNEEAPLCRLIKTAMADRIKELYSNGVKLFYAGCAVGVDTWAAEITLDLKQQTNFPEIQLFCAIPFPESTDRFTDTQKKRYEKIIAQSNYTKTVSRHYSPVAYKRLNYFLVDNSQYLIAVYDEDKSERSGLGQMVNYAIKKNLHITFIHPDTAQASIYVP